MASEGGAMGPQGGALLTPCRWVHRARLGAGRGQGAGVWGGAGNKVGGSDDPGRGQVGSERAGAASEMHGGRGGLCGHGLDPLQFIGRGHQVESPA